MQVTNVDFQKLVKIFTASLVGIAASQVLIGAPIFELWLTSSCGNVNAPAVNLAYYIVSLSLFFALAFYFVYEEVRPTPTASVGFKIGMLFGAVSSIPFAFLMLFFSPLSYAFVGGSILISIIDYGVAGALTMVVLGRSPAK